MKNNPSRRFLLAATLSVSSTLSALSANVGLNTNTPGSTLSVNGNLAVGPTFCLRAAPSGAGIFEGFVGIGTSNPAYPLHLYGSALGSMHLLGGGGGSNFVMRDSSGTTANNNIYFSGASQTDFGIFDDIYHNNTGSLGFYDYHINNWAMTLAGNGNVSIGPFAGPAFSLHVAFPGDTVEKVEGRSGAIFYLEADGGAGAGRAAVLFGRGADTGRFQIGSNYFLDGQSNLFFFDNAAGLRMIIDSRGYIGINTPTPLAPFHIVGSRGVTGSGSHTSMISQTANLQSSSSLSTAGFVCSGDFGSNGSYIAINGAIVASDGRLKNIIAQSNSLKDLEMVKRIKVVDYQMKDVVQCGNLIQKKVIAQDVEKIFPSAVKKIGRKNITFLPNIYVSSEKVAKEGDGSYTIHLPKEHELKEGDKIRIVRENGKSDLFLNVHVLSESRFSVQSSEPLGEKVFVYGTECLDLKGVDYNALAMLDVSATQEVAQDQKSLSKPLEKLSAALIQTERKLTSLHTGNGDREEQLDRLERMHASTAQAMTDLQALQLQLAQIRATSALPVTVSVK